jgi:two-component system, OmpR family, KDP operon response regulator KdpE
MESTSLRILVADDERPIRHFIHTLLVNTYKIFEAETGLAALQAVAVHHPDIVLLDLGLPDIDGLEVIHRLREWTNTPIIVISIRDSEAEKIAALDNGADDYLTKPFSAGELMARIRAALRHAYKKEVGMVYQSGDLSVNLAKREVRVADRLIALTPIEYDILRALVNHAGMVMTHQQLIHQVWGTDTTTDSHLLRVNVSNLRRKIEIDPVRPRHIVTESGVGYRLRQIEA